MRAGCGYRAELRMRELATALFLPALLRRERSIKFRHQNCIISLHSIIYMKSSCKVRSFLVYDLHIVTHSLSLVHFARSMMLPSPVYRLALSSPATKIPLVFGVCCCLDLG